jgi:hypothetical protein
MVNSLNQKGNKIKNSDFTYCLYDVLNQNHNNEMEISKKVVFLNLYHFVMILSKMNILKYLNEKNLLFQIENLCVYLLNWK